jgi:outer membrane protein
VSRRDVVKALEVKLDVDRKNLAAARSRFEVGQSPRGEVLRADLVVTQDEQNLLVQRNAFEAARLQLGILLVVPGAVDAVRPVEPEDPTLSDEEMVATALGRRADLRAADLSVGIAKQGKKAAWWSFLPSLDAGFLWRWTEAAGFAGERNSWNLTLTLTVPIYDGGLRYADLREATSRIIEARAQKQALDLEVRSEIVRLRSELQSATSGLISARKAVALARTTAGDMEASFEVGAATQLDVLDANQRLLDAELQLTTTLYTRDLARLALAHAQGRFDPSRGAR